MTTRLKALGNLIKTFYPKHVTLHKKTTFPLRISSVNGKLYFLCSGSTLVAFCLLWDDTWKCFRNFMCNFRGKRQKYLTNWRNVPCFNPWFFTVLVSIIPRLRGWKWKAPWHGFFSLFRNRVLTFLSTRNICLGNFLCYMHKTLEIRQKISWFLWFLDGRRNLLMDANEENCFLFFQ